MISLLVVVHDKTKLAELYALGTVTYVSDYTHLIGFSCPEANVALLRAHPNISHVENADTGMLLN